MGTGNANCTLCSAGTASSVASLTTTCSACLPGYFAGGAGNTACSACLAGTYSSASAGFDKCTPCPAGSISALNMSSQCSTCPAGSFSNAMGLTSCRSCSASPCASNQRQITQCSAFSDKTCVRDSGRPSIVTVYTATNNNVRFSAVTAIDILVVGGGGSAAGGSVVVHMDYLVQPDTTFTVSVGAAGQSSWFGQDSNNVLHLAEHGNAQFGNIVNGVRVCSPLPFSFL